MATLRIEGSFTVELDGVDLRSSGLNRTQLEVLPGEHSIGVMLYTVDLVMGVTYFSTEPYMLCLTAEAGKTYVVRVEREDDLLLWRPQVFERRAPSAKVPRTWYGAHNVATACPERRAVKTAYAAELYGALCSNGNAQGCFNLGELYRDGHEVPQDEGRAATLFEKACDGGVALGCNSLGVLYKEGRGVPKDERRAAALFATACEDGLSSACGP